MFSSEVKIVVDFAHYLCISDGMSFPGITSTYVLVWGFGRLLPYQDFKSSQQRLNPELRKKRESYSPLVQKLYFAAMHYKRMLKSVQVYEVFLQTLVCQVESGPETFGVSFGKHVVREAVPPQD